MNKRIMAMTATGVVVVSAGAAAAATASSGGTSSDYTPLASTRVIDTRTQGGPLGSTKTLTVGFGSAVPADATAVTVNITVVAPTATSGDIEAYADGTTRPAQGSNVNFTKGETVANQATVPVSNGKIDLYNYSGGTVQLIVDLEGYYTPSAPTYVPPTSTTWNLPAASQGEPVDTGGSAVSNAKLLDDNGSGVGTITLQPGTYLVSFSAKATPTDTSSAQTFPQFFVYDEALSSTFAGDVLNVGSGALESGGNTNIDSYFSGSGEVVITAPNTTLYVYGFGYRSDRGAGTYTLDTASLTAVPIND